MTTRPEVAAEWNANLKMLRKVLDKALAAHQQAPTDDTLVAAQAARAALDAAPRPTKGARNFHSRDMSQAARSGRRQHAEQAARTAAALAKR